MSESGHVRSSAEFYRVSKLNYPNRFTILFTKQRHGTHFFGLPLRRVPEFFQRGISPDFLIYHFFNGGKFFFGYLAEMRKVEAQIIRMYKRSFLLHVSTEYFSEGVMQQVGGAVIGRRKRSFPFIHIGGKGGFRIFRKTI